jgi:hypothetical protein
MSVRLLWNRCPASPEYAANVNTALYQEKNPLHLSTADRMAGGYRPWSRFNAHQQQSDLNAHGQVLSHLGVVVGVFGRVSIHECDSVWGFSGDSVRLSQVARSIRTQ